MDLSFSASGVPTDLKIVHVRVSKLFLIPDYFCCSLKFLTIASKIDEDGLCLAEVKVVSRQQKMEKKIFQLLSDKLKFKSDNC